ncbi:MAG: hypothetical protein N2589_03205, partial [bacterium]|nr:hypothetical protein [bacterium]
MRKKIEKIEKAIETIGKLNNTKIIKELTWSWNPFRENFRYFDLFNREYKATINRNEEITVKVYPVKIEKILNFNEGKKEYIIIGDKIYRKIDPEIISKFILEFLKKRNFEILNGKINIINEKKIEIKINEHIGEIEITRTKPFCEFRLKDKEIEKP